MDYQLLNQSELPAVNGVRASEGRLLDEASVSLLFVDIPPGDGPRLHRHPYKEIFIVHDGRARFTIGTISLEVVSGQIVVVAKGVPHKFVNSGNGTLRQTDIHLSREFETEWLESLNGNSDS